MMNSQYLTDVADALAGAGIGYEIEHVGGPDHVLIVDNPDGSKSVLSQDYILGVYPSSEAWEDDQCESYHDDLPVLAAVDEIARRHNG